MDYLVEVTRHVHALLHTALPATKHIWNDLCGACAIGAFAVRHVLWQQHRKRGILVGDSDEPGHVWVRVGDVHLDPTYEQYDKNKPYLVCSNAHPLFGDGVALSELPGYWPEEQHPATFWQDLGFGPFVGLLPKSMEKNRINDRYNCTLG